MKISRVSILMMAVFIPGLLLPPGLQAIVKPEVTRHEVQYLQNAVSILIQWQSPNPVTLVKIAIANQQKEIKVDEYDNKRNRDGYAGEVSVVVKFDSEPAQPIPYVIQLEDDLQMKSDLINGRAKVAGSSQPEIQTTPSQEGIPRLGMSPAPIPVSPRTLQSEVKSGDVVDKLIGAVERYDRAPILDQLRVNRIDADTISISTKADDDKGLREVNFSILDRSGNKIDGQTLTNLGRIWQGTSKSFKLPPGSYNIVAQAVDTGGNTSQEQRAEIVVEGSGVPPAASGAVTSPAAAQTASPAPGQAPSSASGTASSPAAGQAGSLTVNLGPRPAVEAGAMWRVDNGSWQKSGETIPDLPAGIHTLEFAQINGWSRPEDEKVMIESAQNLAVDKMYRQ